MSLLKYLYSRELPRNRDAHDKEDSVLTLVYWCLLRDMKSQQTGAQEEWMQSPS